MQQRMLEIMGKKSEKNFVVTLKKFWVSQSMELGNKSGHGEEFETSGLDKDIKHFLLFLYVTDSFHGTLCKFINSFQSHDHQVF